MFESMRDNLYVSHNASDASNYVMMAAKIARRLRECHNSSAVEYLATVQLEELVSQGSDLDYNQLVEYATELANDHDPMDLVAKWESETKFFEAFENAGLDGEQLGGVVVDDDIAKYMGLTFTFNRNNELVLGDA